MDLPKDITVVVSTPDRSIELDFEELIRSLPTSSRVGRRGYFEAIGSPVSQWTFPSGDEPKSRNEAHAPLPIRKRPHQSSHSDSDNDYHNSDDDDVNSDIDEWERDPRMASPTRQSRRGTLRTTNVTSQCIVRCEGLSGNSRDSNIDRDGNGDGNNDSDGNSGGNGDSDEGGGNRDRNGGSNDDGNSGSNDDGNNDGDGNSNNDGDRNSNDDGDGNSNGDRDGDRDGNSDGNGDDNSDSGSYIQVAPPTP
jgi:hypothetical protein